jgi:hypothetical protein
MKLERKEKKRNEFGTMGVGELGAKYERKKVDLGKSLPYTSPVVRNFPFRS